MNIQWPLVLFSLIAGTGGSLFAFAGLSEFCGGMKKTRESATIVAIVLIIVGGCLSMLHLANPLHVMSAVTNLLSFSGISMELILLGICFVLMAAYLIVSKRAPKPAALKALGALGIVFGLLLGFFCGHGYVIEAQPTWNTNTLPFAYLGSCLASGAFLWALVARRCKSSGELSGHEGAAMLIAAIICALGLLSYAIFLGADAGSAHAVAFWGGVVVLGTAGTLVCAIAGFRTDRVAFPQKWAIAGLVCAFLGGLSLRCIMWLCATGYIDLFAHTVPSVMLNL